MDYSMYSAPYKTPEPKYDDKLTLENIIAALYSRMFKMISIRYHFRIPAYTQD